MKQIRPRDIAGWLVLSLVTFMVIRSGPVPLPVSTQIDAADQLMTVAEADSRSLLTAGDPGGLGLTVYGHLDRCGHPAVLFDTNMRPVVWNHAATWFEGEYDDTLPIQDNDRIIGYLGMAHSVTEAGEVRDRTTGLSFLFALALLLLILVGRRLPMLVLALLLILVEIRYGMKLPFLFLQCASLTLAGPESMRRGILPALLFSGFLSLSLFQVFQAPVNGLLFFESLSNPQFSIALLTAFLAAAMLLLTGLHRVAWIPALVAAPFCPMAIPMLASLYGFRALLKDGRIWAPIVGVMLVSGVLLAMLYGTTGYRIHRSLDATETDPAAIQQQAMADLDTYLELAATGSFQDLRDYVRRSGILDTDYDFELVYFNNVGEVVDVYTWGLPSLLELPVDRSLESIAIGHHERLVAAGTDDFKYGYLSLRLSADLYNLPFLHAEHPFRGSFDVLNKAEGQSLRFRFPTFLQVITDLSLLGLLSMVLLVTFLGLTLGGRQGLFRRTVYSQFTVLTGILVLAAGIVGFQSRSLVRQMLSADLFRTADTLAQMTEKDQDDLSDNYLKFLQSTIPGRYALYGEGILTFSTDHLKSPVLVEYPAFHRMRQAGSAIEYGDVLYVPVLLDRFPDAVLRVEPEAGWAQSRPASTARPLVLLLFLLLLSSFAMTGYMARRMVTPILQLSEASRGVARGKYDIRVPYREPDEIGTLVSSMTEMARSIRDQRLNLEALLENVSSAVALVDPQGEVVAANPLFHKLPVDTARDSLLRETGIKQDMIQDDRHYQTASVELENGSRVVIVDDVTDVIRVSRLSVITDMARQISHDVKNPLTPIRLNAEYITSILERDPEKAGDTIPGAIDNILKKTEELRAIASQFSNLVKATERPPDKLEPIAIRSFLMELASAYPGLTLVINGPNANVLADELKLTRVFGNLLENSFSFTDGKGRVDISMTVENGALHLEYCDSGRGIPEELAPRIFEPYFSTRDTGTGLGLFIVREFLLEMGGKVEAVPSDSGACFRITLKVATDD